MIRIIDKRSSGKTKSLMQVAEQQNAIFVCANPQGMEVKAKAYGLNNVKCISYHDFVTSYEPGNIVIDEAEQFIQSIMGDNQLVGYSLTTED